MLTVFLPHSPNNLFYHKTCRNTSRKHGVPVHVRLKAARRRRTEYEAYAGRRLSEERGPGYDTKKALKLFLYAFFTVTDAAVAPEQLVVKDIASNVFHVQVDHFSLFFIIHGCIIWIFSKIREIRTHSVLQFL